MELLFPILLIVLVGFMFLSVRRQKKNAAQVQEMQDSLRIGVRVQTTSGTYGTVTGLEDGVVDLELAPGVVTRWNRLAVREVVHDDDLAGSYPGAPVPGSDESLSDDSVGPESLGEDRFTTSDGNSNGVAGAPDDDHSVTLDKRADRES